MSVAEQQWSSKHQPGGSLTCLSAVDQQGAVCKCYSAFNDSMTTVCLSHGQPWKKKAKIAILHFTARRYGSESCFVEEDPAEWVE